MYARTLVSACSLENPQTPDTDVPEPDITIRPYSPEDLAGCMEVFLQAIWETAAHDYKPAQIRAWTTIDKQEWAALRLGRPTWVAVRQGQTAGFIDLEADGHLDLLYVHPRHGRMGVASALLHNVESAARKQGSTRLFTESSITARPFFERQGFQLITPQIVRFRDLDFTNFAMQKLMATHKAEMDQG